MREILFRGKSIISGEWVFGTPVCVEENTYPTDRVLLVRTVNYDELDNFIPQYESEEVIPATVGQFTGLCDRNGNKVFEGDALEIERKSDGLGTYYDPPLKYPAKVVVRWDMCSWLWEVCGKEKYYLHFPDAWCHYKCQVVGNIHDNPELVKEDTK